MAYRIRFQPKQNTRSISVNTAEWIQTLLQEFDSWAAKKNLDDLVSKIKHFGGRIVETSNLRTIVAPDDTTKARQKAILRELERLPMHRSAHGFVKGRDSLSCAQAHLTYWGTTESGLVVLNMDARNFFHSVTSPHLRRALEGHGIKPKHTTAILEHCTAKADGSMALAVIEGLQKLHKSNNANNRWPLPQKTVDAAIAVVKEETPQGRRLAFVMCQVFLSLGKAVTAVNRFLPQGSPTSPFLSNLTMKLADIRLTALAKSFGGFYTRYADDLTITWMVPTKGASIDGMYRCTMSVLEEYGIELNKSKKRVMGTSRPQDIVGYCINAGRPTISRSLRRKLRAALHNEMVRGSKKLQEGKRKPQRGEDYKHDVPNAKRLQHLQGLVSYVGTAHPAEALKGRVLLEHLRHRPSRDFATDDESNNDTLNITLPGDMSRNFEAD